MIGLSILLLACAVFGWGLHSKLSLYRVPAHASVHAPQAKLLSERERPLIETQHSDLHHADLHALTITAIAVLLPVTRPAIQTRRIAEPPPPPLSHALKGPSLRRPPPSLVA